VKTAAGDIGGLQREMKRIQERLKEIDVELVSVNHQSQGNNKHEINHLCPGIVPLFSGSAG